MTITQYETAKGIQDTIDALDKLEEKLNERGLLDGRISLYTAAGNLYCTIELSHTALRTIVDNIDNIRKPLIEAFNKL